MDRCNRGLHELSGQSTILVVLSKFASVLYSDEVDWIVSELKLNHRVELIDPASISDPLFRLESKAKRGLHSVLVFGGDGTINWVVNALKGRNCPLAVFPAGTANDLAAELGLSRDPKKTVDAILGRQLINIDAVDVNGTLFCTVGGLGLPSDCAKQVSDYRLKGQKRVRSVHRIGAMAYRLSAFTRIIRKKSPLHQIEITYQGPSDSGEHSLTVDTAGLFVGNQGTVAGGLRISPDSQINDGVLEIAVLQRKTRTGLMLLLLEMISGIPFPGTGLISIKIEKAVVSCREALWFFGDGELLMQSNEFRIRPVRNALRIVR
jgi:diacylglycerol kinase family enzyme